jgi:hypothetical protein
LFSRSYRDPHEEGELDDMSEIVPYPDDADGDALRSVAESGADMSRPMKIEFTISAPSHETAVAIAEMVSVHGYVPEIYVDEQDYRVSLYCARVMMATYSGVVDAQAQLNRLCRPYAAECDGWITTGNRQDQ